MNSQTWWYLSRASGIVAWVLLTVACLWGVLMVTRMLKPADRPAWMLDLHRWLGALSVTTTGVHLAALVADNYVHFGWAEILVPQASEWKRWPVTMGVIAFYILIVVEASSQLMKKLPQPVWHGIHLTSYICFGFASAHGVYAGTDRRNLLFMVFGSGLLFVLAFATVARYLQGRAKHAQRQTQRATA